LAEPLETEVHVVGTQQFVRDLSECYHNILRVGEATKATRDQMREARAPILALRRAVVGMRTAYRMQHAAMLEGMRFMMSMGTMGKQITHMWQAWNVAQIRVTQAQEGYAAAQERVNLLQNEATSLQRQGVTSGKEYLDVQLKLNEAKAQAEARSKALAKAQQDNLIGYIGIGLQVTGLIPRIQDLYYHYKNMRNIHEMSKTSILGEVAARWSNVGAKLASAKASALNALRTGAETAAKYAHVAATWLQVHALAILNSMTPTGWAILAGAGIAAAGALAWITTEQAKSQRGKKKGGSIEEEGWYYLHRKEEVIPAKEVERRQHAPITPVLTPITYKEHRERSFSSISPILAPSMKRGGEIKEEGIYYLHRKEEVIPAKERERLTSTMIATTNSIEKLRPININVPSMKEGGEIPESGWYHLHKKEEVIRAPVITTGGIGVAFVPARKFGDIYIRITETKSARETAEETIDAMRRRGLI